MFISHILEVNIAEEFLSANENQKFNKNEKGWMIKPKKCSNIENKMSKNRKVSTLKFLYDIVVVAIVFQGIFLFRVSTNLNIIVRVWIFIFFFIFFVRFAFFNKFWFHLVPGLQDLNLFYKWKKSFFDSNRFSNPLIPGWSRNQKRVERFVSSRVFVQNRSRAAFQFSSFENFPPELVGQFLWEIDSETFFSISKLFFKILKFFFKILKI